MRHTQSEKCRCAVLNANTTLSSSAGGTFNAKQCGQLTDHWDAGKVSLVSNPATPA